MAVLTYRTIVADPPWPFPARMSKMREALLYVGSAHESVKRDALAEVEQWESELEVMAGTLSELEAEIQEAGNVNSRWKARHDDLVALLNFGNANGETESIRAWCGMTLREIEAS